MSASEPVTVFVPVYRGLDDVRACLESVLSHTARDLAWRLHVIEDASPEPDVRSYVSNLHGRDLPVGSTVERNETNLGFVRTVNVGLREAPGDVVLLNADTVVTDGWLASLYQVARGHADVATVTPLTNFGSLCTLPETVRDRFDLDGPEPDIEGCADFIRGRSLGLTPSVISGVGFCMYTTRDAIEHVGVFDEETFGQGYGEEVDFCLRATRLGFVHLVDDSTYVHHRGGGSFGDERDDRIRVASRKIHERYPFFRATNTRERRREPLATVFANLELGLRRRISSRPHVLQFLHSRPGSLGGTEKHTAALMEALDDDYDFSTLYPVPSGYVLRTHWRTGSTGVTAIEFLFPGGARRTERIEDENEAFSLEMILGLFDFDAVHIQNLIGHSLAPLEVLRGFEGPVIYSLRDMYLLCPHHWLLYRNESPCGVPDDLTVCASCLPVTKGLDVDHLVEHRAFVGSHLDVLDHIVVASMNSVDYLLRRYDVPAERFVHIEHGAILPPQRRRREVDVGRIREEPLRIAFVGLGRTKKGFDRVVRLARDVSTQGIEIHHFGSSDAEDTGPVIAHGWYDNEHLPALLDDAGIHAVLLPGLTNETFGHVMTESLFAGLPVIGASHGALGERIRRDEVGWVVDVMDYDQIRDLVTRLDRDRDELLRVTRNVVELPIRTVADTAPDYATLYAQPEEPRGEMREMSEEERTNRRRLRALAAVNHQLLAQLEEAQAGVRSERRPFSVTDGADLVSRTAEIEAKLQSIKSRRALRIANALGKIRRARSLGDLRKAFRQLGRALTKPGRDVDLHEIERSSRRR